jgi:hypothetical protein
MKLALIIWAAVSAIVMATALSGFLFALGYVIASYHDDTSPAGWIVALMFASAIVLFAAASSMVVVAVMALVRALRGRPSNLTAFSRTQ